MSNTPEKKIPPELEPAHDEDAHVVDSGDTRMQQEGDAAPRLPHEHDQSADSQSPTDGKPTPVGRQAHEDLERGLQDTDRGPVLEKLGRKLRP